MATTFRNKSLISLLAIVLATTLQAQQNVRAWYADGQVWVVWETTQPLPETYAIYAKPTQFNNTASATLLGRLFPQEYFPGALREQVDSAATYKIPNGQGGTYQLKNNEGLFVATPHQAGALWIAVVAWGETTVTPGVNLTQGPVSFLYSPANDPVECHLQQVFPSPFSAGHYCFAFYIWADGRQNQWENRPDFPVMANAAKNGMPSLFMISAPIALDTAGGIPLSIWLHGGGGTARQSLAGSRTDIHLNPKKGILLAHNDDLIGKLLTFFSGLDGVSRHFGWRKNYDPFSGDPPTAPDTIVNYTQRRYIWIDEWLIKNWHIDRHRININGHSMGSKGTTMLAKAFPEHYASATILNNGFEEADPPALIDVIFGPSASSFPTNLTDYSGKTVGYSRAMNLDNRLSTMRDLPLLRVFSGKNDTQSGASWDAYVVEQYRAADSLGWGAQLYWSERSHGPDTGPDYDDHWINGNAATQQTVVDDIAYEEEQFRSDVSFPAFFNHRLDQKNNDPGDGTSGTGPNGDGDDWGTWGGYHRWDENTTADQPNGWAVTTWLEANAVFDNDNCPNNFLTASVAIRKPQKFKPAAGKILHWSVKDTANGAVLQNGTTVVQADGLVVLPQIAVFRENIRRVRIEVIDQTVATGEPTQGVLSNLSIMPNPGSSSAYLTIQAQKTAEAIVCANGIDGRPAWVSVRLQAGENRVPMSIFENLPTGFYGISVQVDGVRQVVKWIKI
ncbi:MAG: hypothetical protein ABMA02_14845 [Saprospiraceae bacterium]